MNEKLKPCKGCPDHRNGCRERCNKWHFAVAFNEAKKRRLHKIVKANTEFVGYTSDRRDRLKRRFRRCQTS